MGIKALHISNFKGIESPMRVELKPITIFLGPNSSGKSSCLHALGALSQTVKLPNNTRPISLDDEFADVHLGRFIEVVHSKSYQDQIALGLELEQVSYLQTKAGTGHETVKGDGRATYEFGCVKRTQEIRLEKADFSIGKHEYVVRRTARGHEALKTPGGSKSPALGDRDSCSTFSCRERTT